MARLKLGKLPDRETSKITFTVSAELKMLLADYATAYEKEYGRKEVVTELIPHMLEAFIRGDRGFRKKRGIDSNRRSAVGLASDLYDGND